MDRLLSLSYRVARAGTWFGCGLLILASFLIGIDVVIRKLFSLSIGGADELSGYALAIASAWAFAYALLERAHVRIDSLYVTLPRWVRATLDVLGLAVFVAVMALVAWRAFGVFSESVKLDAHSMSPIATPLVYPQALWVAGLILFVLIGCLLLVRVVVAFVTGDTATVHRLAGSRSVTEEIEHETQHLGQADEPERGA
ncbi:MAG: TRAP transporter small permease [Immundisolibacterales bacterium]|nr:TRAP transporter small permease [Immundisolibacterales bacterium]